MSKILFFDTQSAHENLLPLSFTRPISHFRVGITTLAEKWHALLPGEYDCWPVEYMRPRFTQNEGAVAQEDDILWIAGGLIADNASLSAANALQVGEAIVASDGEVLLFRGSLQDFSAKNWTSIGEGADLQRIKYVFDIFLQNPRLVTEDFFRLTSGRESQPLDASNRVLGPMTDDKGRPMIFIEEGASVECAILSTKEGPIYIGRDAVVMEGCLVRGPIAFCRKSQARMGAKLYSGSTFGPYVKVGGEVSNAVIFGYSNKSHDGYLGNAVIGEWCNLGAGVNASNLKNDYAKIRIWNYATHTFMKTDLQFCGLIMGDHSKAGVNCMFNTATVVGVGVNVHGAGFPRVFLPSFSEGSPSSGFKSVSVSKFETIASRVMARRGMEVTDADRMIYEAIYKVSSKFKS